MKTRLDTPLRSRRLAARAVLCLLLLVAFSAEAKKPRPYRTYVRDGVTVITNARPPAPKSKPSPPPAITTPQDSIDAWQKAKAEARAEYEVFLAEACELYNVPVALARAVIQAESAFNAFAVSPKGAMGLMQLMPGTAAEMFVDDCFDPRQNIHGGVRYLRVLANLFDGDLVRMIAAYNAGPEAVRRANGIPSFAETQEYVRRVLQYYEIYREESAT